jgi:hypothetical protein
MSRDLLGQQRAADATLDLEIALLVANPVLVTAEPTGRQALGVVRRVGVEATGDAAQLVLQVEDAGRTSGSHGTLGRVQRAHAADATTHGHLVEDDEQEGDHDNLGHLHFIIGWEKRLR